ncbi:hypothetical protein FDO65_08630 [Nakamurella flava]|uniref:DUF5343 domain-containing protein n=1 Tax=Nakamurella flava TaxID=2576308 RepID=A0A4U6QM00_9ACTN|nr:hypothetical protein FDO65_08630 [Nakamurella flava]
MVGLLKAIGFVDPSGVPTSHWKEYRGNDHKRVAAEATRKGYASLFEVYPDADSRDDEAIANLIRQNSNYSSDTVARVVGSFKALCSLADFGEPNEVAETIHGHVAPTETSIKPTSIPMVTLTPGLPAINLNIQLELPSNADEKFYDAFFAALKKHLMQ